MLDENKVKCYKEIFAYIQKDKDISELAAPEPRSNFDFIYYIKDVLYTYSLKSQSDLLTFSAEILFDKEIDEFELNKIKDKLIGSSPYSGACYNNYIKIQMAFPINNMPEENAVNLVFEKASEFHDTTKKRISELNIPTIKVEYKGEVTYATNEDNQFIGESTHKLVEKNIMEKFLSKLKISYNEGEKQVGILDGHSISGLDKNIIHYDFDHSKITLRYTATNNIIKDDTLSNSNIKIRDNSCIISDKVSSVSDIEKLVTDMISIINYIENNRKTVIEEPEPESKTVEEKDTYIPVEASMNTPIVEKSENNVSNDDINKDKSKINTDNIKNNSNADKKEAESAPIKAQFFSINKKREAPIRPERKKSPTKIEYTMDDISPKKEQVEKVGKETSHNNSNKDTEKADEKASKEYKDTKEKKLHSEFDINKYSDEVRDEYIQMYKTMNKIYEERENVFVIKEAKLHEREITIMEEQENLNKTQASLNIKWDEINRKQQELNKSFSDYTKKMSDLNLKEVEIAKATCELDEKAKDYETKFTLLQSDVEKYEIAKRNLNDKQAELIELKNNLDEKETKILLLQSEINKKSEMNTIAEHQLSAREHTLNARQNAEKDMPESEYARLKNEYDAIKLEYDEFCEAYTLLVQTNTDLDREINEIIDECNKRLQEMEDNANELIERARNEASSVVDEKALTEKESEITSLKKTINELENKNKELKELAEKNNNNAEVERLKSTILDLNSKKSEAVSEQEILKDKINTLNEKNNSLEKEVKKYKELCEPDISARATKELLNAAGYDFDLIPTEGDVIVGCEIDNISICINENESMIYAEKEIKKGVKQLNKIVEWNDESISTSYVILPNKAICKKKFDNKTVVNDVIDIIDKFSELK